MPDPAPGSFRARLAQDAPRIRGAVDRMAAAARRAGKPVSVLVGSRKEAEWLRGIGASCFVHSSDQGFMKQAAAKAPAEARALGARPR